MEQNLFYEEKNAAGWAAFGAGQQPGRGQERDPGPDGPGADAALQPRGRAGQGAFPEKITSVSEAEKLNS